MRKLLAGVLLAVTLAACGGDSDKSSQNTSSTQTAATLTARLETTTPTATPTATATATATATPTPAATPTPTPTTAATAAPTTPAPTPQPTATPTRAPTPAPTPPPTPAPAQAQTVEVKAGEWFYEPAQIAVQAGAVTINLVNNGPDRPHTFGIRNPNGGADVVRSAQVPVGRSLAIQANLQPGTYEFYCSLPGHADRGQKGTLTVR